MEKGSDHNRMLDSARSRGNNFASPLILGDMGDEEEEDK
jgi:hypothetical protein